MRKGGPWTFDRCVLLTKHLQEDEELVDVELFEIELWVQMYNFPTSLQSERVLREVGNSIGLFVEVDDIREACEDPIQIKTEHV